MAETISREKKGHSFRFSVFRRRSWSELKKWPSSSSLIEVLTLLKTVIVSFEVFTPFGFPERSFLFSKKINLPAYQLPFYFLLFIIVLTKPFVIHLDFRFSPNFSSFTLSSCIQPPVFQVLTCSPNNLHLSFLHLSLLSKMPQWGTRQSHMSTIKPAPPHIPWRHNALEPPATGFHFCVFFHSGFAAHPTNKSLRRSG